MKYTYRLESQKGNEFNILNIKKYYDKEELINFLLEYCIVNFSLKEIIDIIEDLNIVIENSTNKRTIKFTDFCNTEEFVKKISKKINMIRYLNKNYIR